MPGLRQIILILGVIFLFRLIGKVMTARRNINEHKRMQKHQKATKSHHSEIGKTSISKIDKRSLKNEDYTNYEEVE